MKKMKTLTIKEEMRIPGTDIILEAGDKIGVLKEALFLENSLEKVFDYIMEANPDGTSFEVGETLAYYANKVARRSGLSQKEFFEGFTTKIKDLIMRG